MTPTNQCTPPAFILLNLRGLKRLKVQKQIQQVTFFLVRFDFAFYPTVNVWELKMTLGLVKNEVVFLHVTILGYEMTLLHNLP